MAKKSDSVKIDEKISFEAALKRLEEIVEKMEDGEIDLDSMINVFEEGQLLVKHCSKRLEAIERKVEEITKDASGKVVSKPYDEDIIKE